MNYPILEAGCKHFPEFWSGDTECYACAYPVCPIVQFICKVTEVFLEVAFKLHCRDCPLLVFLAVQISLIYLFVGYKHSQVLFNFVERNDTVAVGLVGVVVVRIAVVQRPRVRGKLPFLLQLPYS